ncbi:MAG: methylenetetrahydrofolate reductase [NAD(P)H] [Planctomycetota bacterium]
MRLSQIFRTQRFVLSIEIFPPKTSDGDTALRRNLQTLVEYDPSFVSCTYGAGGSTRDRTLQWCREIQADFRRTAMTHFTCVGSTRDELLSGLDQAVAEGSHNVMALRGDPPAGQEAFKTVEGGLSNANQLVELIRQTHPELGIGVAGYPEKHQEAPSLDIDLQHLKRKVDAGADAVFTQLFFVNDNFFTFRDRCDELGIRIPIVPGIMPITNFARIKRITSMCGTVFPQGLATRLEAVQDDPQAQFEIGVEHAIQQCEELRSAGVPGIHFYALNTSDACQRILDAMHLQEKA